MNRLITIIFFAAITTSSPAVAKKAPQLTPIEIQALQSHEYETTKEILFASTVSVFQDLGYQLDNADLPSGFITASSAIENKTSFWEVMGSASSSGNSKVTAFVEQLGSERAKIRLNFTNSKTTSSLYGQNAKQEKKVLDPATYQAAWEKIDEAVFVRSASKASSVDSPKPSLTPSPTAPPVAPSTSGPTSMTQPDTSTAPTPKS
jgi:lipopolysaccharide export system protein LptA